MELTIRIDLHVQVPGREIHQMASPHRTAAQIRGGFSGSLSSSTSQVAEAEPTMLFQSPCVLREGGSLHHHVSNKSQGSSIILELRVSPTLLSPQIKRHTGRHLLSTFAMPLWLCHLVSPKVSEWQARITFLPIPKGERFHGGSCPNSNQVNFVSEHFQWFPKLNHL